MDRNPFKDFRGYSREEEPCSRSPRRPPPPEHPPLSGLHYLGTEESHSHPEEQFSPPHWDDGRGAERRRPGFRQHFLHYNNMGRSSRSPPRLPRERLPNTSPQRRAQDQGRGKGQFWELSPRERSGEERGRRSTQWPPTPLLHHDRSPPFKRQRTNSDDNHHLGFRAQEEFWEQGYSMDFPRREFGGNAREDLPPRDGLPCRDHRPPRDDHPNRDDFPPRDGCPSTQTPPFRHDLPLKDNCPPNNNRSHRADQPRRENHLHGDNHPQRYNHPSGGPHPRRDNHPRRDFWKSGPIVIDHGHCKAGGWENPHREEFDGNRKARPDELRYKQRSQEWFRHDSREHRFQDFHGPRRSSPPRQERSPMRFENRSGTLNHRRSGTSHSMKDHYNHNRGVKAGPPQTQICFLQASQGYLERSKDEHRGGYKPLREAHALPVDQDTWLEQDQHQDPDHKMTHQRERVWNRSKKDNTTVASEETLTIKVDMSHPAKLNSTMSNSADRQLSLDLVHVGRQRLDFLPMLEHSGTFQETNMHSGTFAQEIISLVHQVKDQYFRGRGLTLDKRFSTQPNSNCSEEETQELTLDRRFSSNRGFSLNISSLLDEDDDDEERLLPRLPVQGLSQPPVRGPGDLRHDLERRRQEKLEGVKVTIPGSSGAQRTPATASEQYSKMQEKMGRGEKWPPMSTSSRHQHLTTQNSNFHSRSTGSDR